MLSYPHRLPAPEIPGVLHQGKRITAGFVRGSMRQGASSVCRFAVIVPKTVDRRAAHRNRTKRLISEALRYILPRLKTPVDCVLVARKDAYDASEPDVRSDLNRLLPV